jgi:hypothetical protein
LILIPGNLVMMSSGGNRYVRGCAEHHVVAIEREPERFTMQAHLQSGIWCPKGHWVERVEVLDTQTGRVVNVVNLSDEGEELPGDVA